MTFRTDRQKGFTLIELLVVIAIIAILAAILFPVFASVRENARRASCQSNEKQISLGILQYLQDFDETFPPTVTEREGINATETTDQLALPFSIRGRLQAFVPVGNYQSGGVYQCPNGLPWNNPATATYHPATTGAAGAVSSSIVYWANDYGFNVNESEESTATTGVSAASKTFFTNFPTFGFNEQVILAKIQNPAGFLLLADAARPDGALGRGSLTPQYNDPAGGNPISYDPADFNSGGSTSGFVNQAAVAPRHRGGINVAYSDGHVKYRLFHQLWRSLTDNDFRYDSTGS